MFLKYIFAWACSQVDATVNLTITHKHNRKTVLHNAVNSIASFLLQPPIISSLSPNTLLSNIFPTSTDLSIYLIWHRPHWHASIMSFVQQIHWRKQNWNSHQKCLTWSARFDSSVSLSLYKPERTYTSDLYAAYLTIRRLINDKNVNFSRVSLWL